MALTEAMAFQISDQESPEALRTMVAKGSNITRVKYVITIPKLIPKPGSTDLLLFRCLVIVPKLNAH